MKVSAKELLNRLLNADMEQEVVEILTEAGYWNDRKVWRYYGDKPRNWATVGNQQSKPDHALVEKLTNAIDTKLIAAARLLNRLMGSTAPVSIFDARDDFFGEQLRDIETLSRSITVAATGRRQRPSITITDDGEGVTPSAMPKTILSLHEGNKEQIPFVQGKFNMGGSGVLEFCGIDHNVELVLSRCNPQLYECRATADVVVEHQIAGPRKCLNCGADKDRRKPGRIFVEPMGKALHRLGVARTGNQRGLGGGGQSKQGRQVRFTHG